jgi:hypothetical protein
MNAALNRTIVRTSLSVVAAVGLGIDAYVHFDLAPTYDVIKTSTLSQGDLFRAEGVVAILTAVALLVRPRRYTAALAFAVAGSALAAALVYRYVNVGSIGPIPSMYEPAWYPEKVRATWAEGIATVASLAVLVLVHLRTSRPRRADAALAGTTVA